MGFILCVCDTHTVSYKIYDNTTKTRRKKTILCKVLMRYMKYYNIDSNARMG